MGDDVKITVIATGFRDQMPARRARMLDVESIPVVSVPVVAPDSWMKEADNAPLRFMSEVEDEERESEAWAAVVNESAALEVSASSVAVADIEETGLEAAAAGPAGGGVQLREYSPRFAELAETAAFGTAGREYPAALPGGTSGAAAQMFAKAAETDDTDLDVPAFLRRGQF